MHTSKADLAPRTFGDYEGRMADSGEWRIAFESVPATFPPDDSPFRGLPDDRCQCPHWGYVVSGAVTFRYADRDEVCVAGDAFYTPPGHIPVKHEPGTELVTFSPTEELRVTEETMRRNMKEMQTA